MEGSTRPRQELPPPSDRDLDLRRRMMGHLKVVRGWRVAAVIPLVGFLLLFAASATAGASTTCTAGRFRYAGQLLGTYSYAGVERFITHNNMAIHTHYSHVISYLGAHDATTCTHTGISTFCHIETGLGLGTIATRYSSSVKPFMEEEDYYGYDMVWETSFSLQYTNFFTVFFNGSTRTIGGGHTIGEMDAYDQPTGSSPILVGNAWVNNYRHQEVGGISEAVNDFTGVACPTVAQFEWFGTVSGTTQVTAASALNYYNGFTKLWVIPEGAPLVKSASARRADSLSSWCWSQ